jgi:palmitoyltransferase
MSWHLYMVSKGETSIESHDNAYLETRARSEGLVSHMIKHRLTIRSISTRTTTVGETISKDSSILVQRDSMSTSVRGDVLLTKDASPPITLLFPLAIPPASNGWSYPRRSLASEPILKPSVKLHAPELAEGLVAENGHAGERRYVMGDEEGLTDDEEGGGGWMD